MLVSDFDYDLPPERIAQLPLPDRDGSRMLHLNRESGSWQDRIFREFPSLLRQDDLLVLNNTKVFPARLYGLRSGERAHPLSPNNPASGDFLRGRIEVLLTRQVSNDPNQWECLVRPGRKIGVGERLYFHDSLDHDSRDDDSLNGAADSDLQAEVIGRGNFGERRIQFSPVDNFFARIERIGTVPLPPYISRNSMSRSCTMEHGIDDRDRYQTVYAQTRGSVAAPTAGLHFTPAVLDQIRKRGIEITEITLHVGLGTFQPLRAERVEDNKLHCEAYEISEAAAESINRAKAERRRVVAIGTTTVRTIEYAAAQNGGNLLASGRGEAKLFIFPGYRFRIVDALLTNFHLPQSSLLMLVCALGGQQLVLNAYRHAVEMKYRFYSYGDCMFVE